MYHVNTYRWDFPAVAALVAPRPLLIANTDKDTIFPLDGVVDVYQKTRRIYRLLGKENLAIHYQDLHKQKKDEYSGKDHYDDRGRPRCR